MNKCLKCDSVDYEKDFNAGTLFCLNCGTIYELNETQKEVSILNYKMGEDFVGGKNEYSGKISRFHLIRRTKQLIYEFCSKLQLSEIICEKSLDFFKKLLDKRKTIGVKKNLIIGVCIYFAAISQGEPMTLFDISDKLKISVYKFGKLNTKLKKVLGLRFIAQDPLIFINRYAEHFQFEYKKNEIIQSAMKTVKMLEKDWNEIMSNPTAIAVTALIIAAKLNGVGKSYDRICKTLGICKQTVSTLINKWKMTATAKMTLEEFMKLDIPGPVAIIPPVQYEMPPVQFYREITGEDIDLSGSDSDEIDQKYLTTNHKQLAIIDQIEN